MKIMILKEIILLMAVLAFGVTNAQPPKSQLEDRPSFAQLLEKMDANEDQMLSAAEVKRPLKKHFTKVDTDGNGFITAEEFENARKPRNMGERPSFVQLLEKMDANKDQMLSAAEVKGPLKKHFTKVDTDGSGFITAEEFKNAPKPRNMGERPSFGELLERMDANKDQMLSAAEVKGPLKKHFTKVDTDGNGFIDAKEFENVPKPKG